MMLKYLIVFWCFVSVYADDDACCTATAPEHRPPDCLCNNRRLKGVDTANPPLRALSTECAPGIQNCADVPWAVFHNGIYWAYAAPVCQVAWGGMYNPIPYGWRFATPDEFSNLPPVESFASPSTYACSFNQNSPSFKCLCAAHVFGSVYQHCDITNYVQGAIQRQWWEIEQVGSTYWEILYVHDPDLVCTGDISVSTDPGQCSATVDLSNAAQSAQNLPISNDAPASFPVGDTVVTFTSGSSSCSITVTVTDDEGPMILGVTQSRAKLWPPNHKFQTVSFNVMTVDNCPDSNVQCAISSVSSNEVSQWEDLDGGPYCGLGGDVFDIIGDLDVNLCSERNGGGNGRIYTISGSCNDGNNNQQSAFSTQVLVPHSQGKK